jgi:hypothetical protein
MNFFCRVHSFKMRRAFFQSEGRWRESARAQKAPIVFPITMI